MFGLFYFILFYFIFCYGIDFWMATDCGGDGGWFWLWKRGWFWSWRRQLVMNVGVVVTNWRKKRIGGKREWSIFFYYFIR